MSRRLLMGLTLAALTTTALADQQVIFRATSTVVEEVTSRLSFAPLSGLLVGQQAVSAPAMYEGPSLQASVAGGEMRTCATATCSDAGAGGWGASGAVSKGRWVQVRIPGPQAPSAKVTATVTAGVLTAEFSATASATAPALGAFANVSGAAGSTVVSAVASFTGQIGGTLSVSGAEYLLCKASGACGSFTTSQGTIDNGDNLQLRTTTPVAPGTQKIVSVTAGSAGGSWTVLSDAAPTSYDFGTCGASGYQGPTKTQCVAAYGTAWASDASIYGMATQGVQTFKIATAGTYRIVAAGAAGGASSRAPTLTAGRGIVQTGDFVLAAGTTVSIVVGQRGTIGDTVGTLNNGNASGGGGGTAVYTSATSPLIVSGGGGGVGYLASATVAQASGRDANAGPAGLPTIKGPPKAGSNGSGGGFCGGCGASSGAGFLGDSAGYPNGDTNNSFASVSYKLGGTAVGGYVRQYRTVSVGDGGFGGGGVGAYGGGGGGGYSGGGLGNYASGDAESNANGNVTASGGGGGGSYNGGSNPAATTFNAGAGYVSITKL